MPNIFDTPNNKPEANPNRAKHSKHALRKMIGKERESLPAPLRCKKARELLKTIISLPEFKRAHRVAFYWPSKGELDPIPLLKLALKMGKQCYLPMLHPSKAKHLLFVEYRIGDKLRLNRYGINEPLLANRSALAPWMLNVIFVPLLGFNKEGHRLGRGGGYYDKTFAFLKDKVNTLKVSQPSLIGLAYEFQQLDNLPYDEWDQLLSGVATEKRIILF